MLNPAKLTRLFTSIGLSDISDDNQHKILVWRSSNQLGEYVVLKPTANSHTTQWDIPGSRLSRDLSHALDEYPCGAAK